MLSFSYLKDKESYRADLRLFQAIYSSRLNNKKLLALYWILFWVFISSLLFFGFEIRDQFFGNEPVVVAMLVIGAFVPINWYLNQLISKKYLGPLVEDTAETFSKTKVTIDENGIALESANAAYQTKWPGVGRTYLAGNTLIIYCDNNFLMIPLDRSYPKLNNATVQVEFENLSGKRIIVVNSQTVRTTSDA